MGRPNTSKRTSLRVYRAGGGKGWMDGWGAMGKACRGSELGTSGAEVLLLAAGLTGWGDNRIESESSTHLMLPLPGD